jgi:polar amino acid transport system substrate-binding protein
MKLTIMTVVGLSIIMASGAQGQTVPASELASAGKLRAGMIAVHVVSEVSKPIGQFIADRLGMAYQPVIYPNPPAYGESFSKNEWDIALGGRVFATSDKADVLSDVYLIELLYVVAPGADIASDSQVDRPGIKIGTVQGSPSDRYLSRTIKAAEIVRIPLGPKVAATAINMMREGRMHVFGVDAGIGYQVTAELPGAKVLPGAFETVPVAIAVPKGRSQAAHAGLLKIISEAKSTGVVQRAIDASRLRGLRVAPN